MSFEIKPRGRIGPALQEIVRSELSQTLQVLGGLKGESLADATHEARKHLKKIRAILSLLREPLGKKRSREARAILRDAARTLGPLRDLQAQLATLDQLRVRFFPGKSPALVRRVRQSFLAQERRASAAFLRSNARTRLVGCLEKELESTATWPVEEYAWKDLRRAMKRSYQQARESYVKAHGAPIGDRLHHWRKKTKELWTHLRLLRKVNPVLMEELADDFSILAEFLGDDRNLMMLRTSLEDRREKWKDEPALETFLELIDVRRGELLDAAFDLAERLFNDSPGEFIDALDERRAARHRRTREAKKLTAQLAAGG